MPWGWSRGREKRGEERREEREGRGERLEEGERSERRTDSGEGGGEVRGGAGEWGWLWKENKKISSEEVKETGT